MIQLFAAKERKQVLTEQQEIRTLTDNESDELADLTEEITYFEDEN